MEENHFFFYTFGDLEKKSVGTTWLSVHYNSNKQKKIYKEAKLKSKRNRSLKQEKIDILDI